MQVFTAPTARRSARGLTLIEMLSVVAIIGVLAGSAMPAFDKFKSRRVLEGTAAEAMTDLHYARSEAVSRNRSVRVSLLEAVGIGQCLVIHTGSAGDCTCSSSGAQCQPGVEVVKSSWFAAGAPARVSSNVASMVVDPVRATFSPAGRLRITLSDGTEVQHIVTPAGRIRSCSPSGGMKGYPAC
jgi:type IV fimbrial biogenesis protein FimT